MPQPVPRELMPYPGLHTMLIFSLSLSSIFRRLNLAFSVFTFFFFLQITLYFFTLLADHFFPSDSRLLAVTVTSLIIGSCMEASTLLPWGNLKMKRSNRINNNHYCNAVTGRPSTGQTVVGLQLLTRTWDSRQRSSKELYIDINKTLLTILKVYKYPYNIQHNIKKHHPSPAHNYIPSLSKSQNNFRTHGLAWAALW
jgi:hypothetical protein